MGLAGRASCISHCSPPCITFARFKTVSLRWLSGCLTRAFPYTPLRPHPDSVHRIQKSIGPVGVGCDQSTLEPSQAVRTPVTAGPVAGKMLVHLLKEPAPVIIRDQPASVENSCIMPDRAIE